MLDNKLTGNKTQKTAIYEAIKTDVKSEVKTEIAVKAVKKAFPFDKRKSLIELKMFG
ncbi:MAG: hypothetical protein LC768_05620 [Acidobacteria bacterium]|nr:hypothetical protein [Acidobacteriota bacterium]MCA1637803.1 hypothetical protein [Acidobacteriota bacterium]